MRQLTAFMKKEWMELIRSGKAMLLLIIFVLLGIMNPAVAKLTPLLFEMMGDQLAEQGIVMTKMEVTALTSWEQFYKNMPIGLVIFVILFCSCLTGELQKGTLINMLTKGLSRAKVMIAKTVMLILSWTVLYWLSYAVTYAYNTYFWDNSIASNPHMAALFMYLTGVWLISLMMLGSSVAKGSSTVLMVAGGGYILCYLLGMVPTITKYLPTYLMGAGNIVKGVMGTDEMVTAVIVTLLLSAAGFILSIFFFNKKKL